MHKTKKHIIYLATSYWWQKMIKIILRKLIPVTAYNILSHILDEDYASCFIIEKYN